MSHMSGTTANHTRSRLAEQRSLILVMLVTGSIMIIEVIGGVLSNSLALLSDAWHMFTDILALFTCLIAGTIAAKPPTESKSFGYHRLEILSALVNGVTLVGVAIYIFYESFLRIVQPTPVNSLEMLVIGVIGLTANLISLGLLSGKVMGLNVKAAFLHILGDALSSIGVVVAAIIIFFTGFYLFDPIVSILIGGVIIVGTSRMLREVLHILLEGTPYKIDTRDILKSIRGVKGVADVHDLHMWSITSYMNYLSAHLVIKRVDSYNINEILNSVKRELQDKYEISHTTMQIEIEGYEEIGEVHKNFE